MSKHDVRFNDFLIQLTQEVALAHTEMQSLQRMAWAETVVHYRKLAEADRNDEIKQIRAEVLSEWNNMVDLAIDEVHLSFNLSKRSWLSRLWGRIRHPFSGKQARYYLSNDKSRSLSTVEVTVKRNDQGIWRSKTNLEKQTPASEIKAPDINQ